MLGFAAIAVAVWLLAIGGWFLASKYFRRADARKLEERLKPVAAKSTVAAGGKKGKAKAKHSGPLILSEDSTTGRIVLGLMRRWNLAPRVEKLLEQAGLRWRPARLAHASLGLFLAAFAAAWQFIPGNLLVVNFACGAVAGSLPFVHVMKTRAKRLHKFEEVFPDALEFVARSMRAGHSFAASLDMIHKEYPEPLSGEFRRASDEHKLGLPLEQALQKLADRIPSLDLRFFVSAVLLQKRTGGNLAEILDKLAYVIRERFKLRGKIKAISAHGRMTGTALSAIPAAVAVLMLWLNPAYVHFFFNDEIGNYMAAGAIGLQVIGYAIINKIVTIEI